MPGDGGNRDINQLNDFAVVTFEDVLGEPDSVKSLNCTWKSARHAFTTSMRYWYTALSTILGLPAAIFWGLSFACLSFQAIWCGSPFFKSFLVIWDGCRKVYSVIVRGLLDPIFESFSIFFSNINIRNV